MSRNRPLKVYVSTTYPSPETMELLGAAHAPGNDRMASAFVAARSLKEGAALMGTKPGSSDRVGGASIYHGKSDDVIEACMANPGQVFVTKYLRGQDRKMVKVGVDPEGGWRRRLDLGRTSTLETGEALLAKDAAEKAAAKEEDERRAKEREERKAHRAQTSQVIEETLERLKPLLEALGINPQTVVAGEGVNKTGIRDRQGILLPAESAERLVRMAMELEEVMGS